MEEVFFVCDIDLVSPSHPIPGNLAGLPTGCCSFGEETLRDPYIPKSLVMPMIERKLSDCWSLQRSSGPSLESRRIWLRKSPRRDVLHGGFPKQVRLNHEVAERLKHIPAHRPSGRDFVIRWVPHLVEFAVRSLIICLHFARMFDSCVLVMVRRFALAHEWMDE